MGASASLRGLFRIPVVNPAFRQSEAGEDAASRYGRRPPVQDIKNILSRSGYTVTQLSSSTGRCYGCRSPYFIPPTFLYKLTTGVTPHICQIVALSESTGYRFVDWMKMCGFDLQHIPRLQMRLHSERTVLVTPMEFEAASFHSQSSAFREAAFSSSISSRLDGAWQSNRRRYLFAKIGRRDALVYPGLTPGVIVRVDRDYGGRIRGADHAFINNLLWLVELPGGLTCCHVKWIGDSQIVLLPSRPPWGSLPLRLPTEARILGLVDTRSRALRQADSQPRVSPIKFEQLSSPCGPEKMKVSDLLRASRRRTGLTFRAAHQLTGAVAKILASRDYAIGLGLLSDYEAMAKLPRHIAKIISLCVTYCIDMRDFMEAAGVKIDDSAKIPLPTLDQPPLPDFLGSAEPYRSFGIGAS